MRKIYSDAYEIVKNGACNPTALVEVLKLAIAVARKTAETNMMAPEYAPARLILGQINYLAGMSSGGYPGWETDYRECEKIYEEERAK
ncbi:MAG: hypothetical protein PHN44_11845 [Candidatus Marinimicrobia bacterium]|nr:hypothetical protein [Candidatus Neomarinimicrobiota bacterium]